MNYIPQGIGMTLAGVALYFTPHFSAPTWLTVSVLGIGYVVIGILIGLYEVYK